MALLKALCVVSAVLILAACGGSESNSSDPVIAPLPQLEHDSLLFGTWKYIGNEYVNSVGDKFIDTVFTTYSRDGNATEVTHTLRTLAYDGSTKVTVSSFHETWSTSGRVLRIQGDLLLHLTYSVIGELLTLTSEDGKLTDYYHKQP